MFNISASVGMTSLNTIVVGQLPPGLIFSGQRTKNGTRCPPSCKPAFQLYKDTLAECSPEAMEKITTVPADTIRRIAAELAHAAFEQEIELDVAWTDWAGRRHDKMIGRPVSMHAMRGISAHSNGFHTCRAIHLLQMLLGSIDCPGGFRSKAPFPRPCPPGPAPTGRPDQVKAGEPMPGPPLGFTTGPEDLLVDADGIVATHTGTSCIEAAGHLVGDGYSVQANMMRGDEVVPAMKTAYEAATGDLADRMVAVLEAA